MSLTPTRGGVPLSEVRVWDRRQGVLLREMSGHTMSTNACCFIPV